MPTRKEALEKLICLKEAKRVVEAARKTTVLLPPILNSDRPDSEKREQIFNTMVTLGVFSADEVPEK